MATSPKRTGDNKTAIDAEVAKSTRHTLNMALLIAVRGWAARPRGEHSAPSHTVALLLAFGLMAFLASGDLSWLRFM